MSPRIRPSAPRRAYTLIELVMVVAILGLLAALLTPQLVQQDSLTVQAAIRQLVADLSFAQADALANQELRRVHFYKEGNGYMLIRVPPTWDTDLVSPDYIGDPLGDNRPYIVDFSTNPRFQGVSIVGGEIDDVLFQAALQGVEVTYDEYGGTVKNTAGNPGTGGYVDINMGDDTYRVTIAGFTGKLTVTQL